LISISDLSFFQFSCLLFGITIFHLGFGLFVGVFWPLGDEPPVIVRRGLGNPVVPELSQAYGLFGFVIGRIPLSQGRQTLPIASTPRKQEGVSHFSAMSYYSPPHYLSPTLNNRFGQ